MNNDETPARKEDTSRERHCINPECSVVIFRGEKFTSRGLCPGCYSTAHRMVILKETTWQELIELGLAMPQAKRGPQRKQSKMMVALLKARHNRFFNVPQEEEHQ